MVNRFPADHWHPGPHHPNIWPDNLIASHRRWGPKRPFRSLLDPATEAIPTEVAGQRAWEFVFPPEYMDGPPVAVAFDAHSGIPLRAETPQLTEELCDVVLDEMFSDDLFAIP